MKVKLREQANPEDYAALQRTRAQVRRQVTKRCTAVDAILENSIDVSPATVFSEEATLRSLKEKLLKLDDEIAIMFAEPSEGEESNNREGWYDRCLEYEMSINEALGKLKFQAELRQPSRTEPKENPISQDG